MEIRQTGVRRSQGKIVTIMIRSVVKPVPHAGIVLHQVSHLLEELSDNFVVSVSNLTC